MGMGFVGYVYEGWTGFLKNNKLNVVDDYPEYSDDRLDKNDIIERHRELYPNEKFYSLDVYEYEMYKDSISGNFERVFLKKYHFYTEKLNVE